MCTRSTARGATLSVWYIKASLHRCETGAELNSPHHPTPNPTHSEHLRASQTLQAYRQEMKALLSVIKNWPNEAIRRAKLHAGFVELWGQTNRAYYYTETRAKSISGSFWSVTGTSHRPGRREHWGLIWCITRLMDRLCLLEFMNTMALEKDIYFRGNQFGIYS